jgi:hypothetical protein
MIPGKHHDTVAIEGRAWRSEGIKVKAISFNTVCGARYSAGIFPNGPLQKFSLRGSTWHWTIAFAPEGLPLEHYRL